MVTSSRDAQSLTDGRHLLLAEAADEMPQLAQADGADPAERRRGATHVLVQASRLQAGLDIGANRA